MWISIDDKRPFYIYIIHRHTTQSELTIAGCVLQLGSQVSQDPEWCWCHIQSLVGWVRLRMSWWALSMSWWLLVLLLSCLLSLSHISRLVPTYSSELPVIFRSVLSSESTEVSWPKPTVSELTTVCVGEWLLPSVGNSFLAATTRSFLGRDYKFLRSGLGFTNRIIVVADLNINNHSMSLFWLVARLILMPMWYDRTRNASSFIYNLPASNACSSIFW